MSAPRLQGDQSDAARARLAPNAVGADSAADAANRTAGTILDIIVKLGRKTEDDEDQFNCD